MLTPLHSFPILQAKGPLADYRSRDGESEVVEAVIDVNRNGRADRDDVIINSFSHLKAFAEREQKTVLLETDVKTQKTRTIKQDCEGGRSAASSTLTELADRVEPVEKSVWGIDFQKQAWFVARQ